MSSPFRTTVIRDNDGSWVGATLRVSMLKPRPENIPAMRASTPNLFSTRTEIVCRMEEVVVEEAGKARLTKQPKRSMSEWQTAQLESLA